MTHQWRGAEDVLRAASQQLTEHAALLGTTVEQRSDSCARGHPRLETRQRQRVAEQLGDEGN